MKLPSDFDIFSPPTSTKPLCTQWRGEAVAEGDGLGPLVLVVREGEVLAAAVDVEAVAEQVERHHDALGVPARAGPSPHGDGHDGSPGLAFFQSTKSTGERFSSLASTRAPARSESIDWRASRP